MTGSAIGTYLMMVGGAAALMLALRVLGIRRIGFLFGALMLLALGLALKMLGAVTSARRH